jgi:hypothetical protein
MMSSFCVLPVVGVITDPPSLYWSILVGHKTDQGQTRHGTIAESLYAI